MSNITIHSQWYPADLAGIIDLPPTIFIRSGDKIALRDSDAVARKVKGLVVPPIEALKTYINGEEYARLAQSADPAAIERAIGLTEKAIDVFNRVNIVNSTFSDYADFVDGMRWNNEFGALIGCIAQMTNRLAESVQRLSPDEQEALRAKLPTLRVQLCDLETIHTNHPTLHINTESFSQAMELWNKTIVDGEQRPGKRPDKNLLATAVSRIVHSKLAEMQDAGYADGDVQFDGIQGLPQGTIEIMKNTHRNYQADLDAHVKQLHEIDDRKGNPGSDYSWKEAKELVIAAYTRLDPDLGKTVKRAFDNGWVFASNAQDRPQGHVVSGLHPSHHKSSHPFVCVYFDRQATDVVTLAHEMGHMLHEMAMQNKSPLAPTPQALQTEVISHLGERFVQEEMIKRAKTPRQRDTLQIEFSYDASDKLFKMNGDFEEAVYRAVAGKAGKDLTLGEIEDLYAQHQQISGRSFWEAINHFLINDFRQNERHIYTLNHMVSEELMEAFARDPDAFRKQLKEGMKAGSTITVYDWWKKMIGPDFKLDEAFSERHMQKLDRQLQEAIAILEAMPDAPQQTPRIKFGTTGVGM